MENEPVKLSKVLRLRPFEQAKIKVVCKTGWLLLIEPRDNLMARYRVRAANGIFEARPDMPFGIIVANFGAKPFVLPRGLHIAQASRSPVRIQQLP